MSGLVVDIVNVSQQGKGSINLLYNRLDDSNLRAAWTWIREYGARIPSISKVADHVLNGALKDQNDFRVILSNLRCCLKETLCPL